MRIILLGYSGHAYVVADAIKRVGGDLIGYCDRAEAKFNPFNLKYLGDEKDENTLTEIKSSGASCIVGVGDNDIRKRITEHLIGRGLHNALIIHPTAIVSDYATIGKGCFISAGAMVNPLASIGKGVIINTGAVVEHECQIGDYAHIAPGAVLTGNVKVLEGCFVGANAVVKQGIKVGENAIIGAGAVVINDVAANQIWVGNPAKQIR
ncbi:sugar O-acyltransferase (sialic acid O-acetyltransferase NeuD family) [Pontibacter aydingkolensis]|uniref:Acetyltransferase n=1 Tax=Pontibacter aydingkolensis TaxID=1911536 RepID=A0ABS7CV43_9BACT|nr:acetyltransferase [Pontibacter aydingkolensis]MBW7467677.1 acetyltransferase [Pontibacter aydingkolensis]